MKKKYTSPTSNVVVIGTMATLMQTSSLPKGDGTVGSGDVLAPDLSEPFDMENF